MAAQTQLDNFQDLSCGNSITSRRRSVHREIEVGYSADLLQSNIGCPIQPLKSLDDLLSHTSKLCQVLAVNLECDVGACT